MSFSTQMLTFIDQAVARRRAEERRHGQRHRAVGAGGASDLRLCVAVAEAAYPSISRTDRIEAHVKEMREMEKKSGFCNVTAIFRNDALEQVQQRLQEIGVNSFSVLRVNGYGEFADFYSPDLLTHHLRIEIFTTARQGDAIAQTIMDAAHSGLAGDGIAAVLPVCKVYWIRRRTEVEPDEL
ncbi:MAG: P-II family nitrogen regulator [Gammaproteobacteria bacterium]|nr:P-II family nitrogen regulator [Gammaproteobacteria bacterium]